MTDSPAETVLEMCSKMSRGKGLRKVPPTLKSFNSTNVPRKHRIPATVRERSGRAHRRRSRVRGRRRPAARRHLRRGVRPTSPRRRRLRQDRARTESQTTVVQLSRSSRKKSCNCRATVVQLSGRVANNSRTTVRDSRTYTAVGDGRTTVQIESQ